MKEVVRVVEEATSAIDHTPFVHGAGSVLVFKLCIHLAVFCGEGRVSSDNGRVSVLEVCKR